MSLAKRGKIEKREAFTDSACDALPSASSGLEPVESSRIEFTVPSGPEAGLYFLSEGQWFSLDVNPQTVKL